MSKIRVIVRRVSAFGLSAGLHALALAATVWLAAHASFLPIARAASNEPSVIIVDATPPADPPPKDLGIQVDTDVLVLPGFTFDFSKIARRATSLFPFLTGDVALQAIAATAERRPARHLTNPFGRGRAESSEPPPLALSDAELQSLIDRSWSRRDRWRAFQPIASLADGFDPNQGRLTDLLRAYGDQNGLQPYVDSSRRDPRFWSQLGLAADHADFIAFISRYAQRHPSSKSTTELLFVLDEIAQASADTLIVLTETDPETQLEWTRTANRAAFHAILGIRAYYLDRLAEHGIGLGDPIRRYYDAARLSILGTLLQTTPNGYRSGDARFLIGAIEWRQGHADDAIRMWRAITPSATDRYVSAYTSILGAIEPSRTRIEAAPIVRALESERGRWLSFSYDRLRQFGYRFNTF